MDIATFSDLTTTTGGTLYQYTPFNPALDHDQVGAGLWVVGVGVGASQARKAGQGGSYKRGHPVSGPIL